MTFSVAGVHLAKRYPEDICRELNVQKLRQVTLTSDDATVAGGDMNRRAMNEQLQCDGYEESGDLPWYAGMVSTSPTDPRSFTDGVRYWNRMHGLPLGDDWSHQWQEPSRLCDGTRGRRRDRIDYLFASVPDVDRPVLEARADPTTPGDYSNHRMVWAMFRVAPTL